MNSVSLDVMFAGLGLFVAHKDRKDQIDVLMPATGATSFGEVPLHVAKLVVPKEYLGAQQDLVLSMDGKCLVLPDPESSAGDAGPLPGCILKICNNGDPEVEANFLHPRTPPMSGSKPRLNARLTLRGAECKGEHAGAHFRVKQQRRALCSMVELTIPITQQDITVYVNDLSTPSNPGQPITLRAKGNRITLAVSHEPKDPHHTPGTPRQPGIAIAHVMAYYGLTSDPTEFTIPVHDPPRSSSHVAPTQQQTESGTTHDPMTAAAEGSPGASIRERLLYEIRGADPVTCLCGHC